MNPDPDEPVVLTETLTGFEAETIASALRAQDIPAETAQTATRMTWGVPIEMVKVMVRRRDLERAQNALRAVKADSVDIDWDEVDVGEEEPPPPPAPRWRSRVLFFAAAMFILGLILALTGHGTARPEVGSAGIVVILGAALVAVVTSFLGGSRPEDEQEEEEEEPEAEDEPMAEGEDDRAD
jgi:hypothetical protein